jgi:hypothetical protein
LSYAESLSPSMAVSIWLMAASAMARRRSRARYSCCRASCPARPRSTAPAASGAVGFDLVDLGLRGLDGLGTQQVAFAAEMSFGIVADFCS